MIKLLRNRLFLNMVQICHIKNLLPDKLYLQMKYRRDYGYCINWKNPRSFTEKMQWLKVYYRKPIMTKLVDKYEVKCYVEKMIGKEYIIPTLGVYNSFDEIDFSSLPESFVLKCTHDSGGLILCKDKDCLDTNSARIKIESSLKKNFYYLMREWPYKYVKPRIIAESYMTDDIHYDLIDYKFYCFNGEPRYCQLITDRSSHESIDFFDKEWVHQDFIGLNPVCKNNPVYKNNPICKTMPKPANYETMIDLARILASDFPFVRVDFYNINGHIYFGEMTFFPAGGFGFFTPEEWNYKLGEMISLPAIERL